MSILKDRIRHRGEAQQPWEQRSQLEETGMTTKETSSMPQYMLLIHNGEWPQLSPEQIQAEMKKYIDYTRDLREKGVFVGGDELQSNGFHISKKGDRFHDAPFAEAKEAIGGYYLIEAKDYAEAVAWAKKCPAFDHGGSLEVRAISVYN